MDPATEAEVQEALSEAAASGVLHLSYCGLRSVSPEVVCADLALVRLDLSHNALVQLPPQVGRLARLEQLWVSHNPGLAELPAELADCTRLRVLDARATALRKLPASLGKLESLFCVDLRDVPTLKDKVRQAYRPWAVVRAEEEAARLAARGIPVPEIGTGAEPQDEAAAGDAIQSTRTLMRYLRHRHQTKLLKAQLEERFCEGAYRETFEAEGAGPVRAVIKAVFSVFQDLQEVKEVIRNCDRLFPARIEQVRVDRIRERFVKLKKENERKKLAAALELKLRAVYFDRIDPAAVEGIVRSVYSVLKELEDIEFLIKHAASIFPERSEDIRAEGVLQSFNELRDRLARERAAAVSAVETSLRGLYAHVEPPQVHALALKVCEFFKRPEDIKKLATDAAEHFPAEFEAAMTEPRSVRASFVASENA